MTNSTGTKTLLFLILTGIAPHCIGQKLRSADSSFFYQELQFIQEAPTILSQSLANQDWTAIENFLNNWKVSDKASEELIFSIQTLLEIQKEQFSVLHFPCNYMYLMEGYSKELNTSEYDPARFRYYIRLNPSYRYDATADLKKIFKVLQLWSAQLIEHYKLKGTQLFLCQVFEGNIDHPRASFHANEKDYADLKVFNRGMTYNNKAYFNYERNRRTGTAAFLLGSWFPAGNLRTIGIHPDFGFLFGVRNKKNEYDLLFGFRFLNCPQNYTVLRSDSLFTSDYYFGGYFSLDYTRYLISRKRFEMGLTTSVGYESFDFIDGVDSEHSDISMTPTDIGSFDFSNGIRVKYFIKPRAFLGLSLKYNLLNYCNHGGTDLKGNAFTVELIYGSH